MKGYTSLSFEEGKMFIENYSLKDNTLTLKMNSGETLTYFFSEEDIKREEILKKVEYLQMESYKKYNKKEIGHLNKNKKKIKLAAFMNSIISVVSTVIVMANPALIGVAGIIAGFSYASLLMLVAILSKNEKYRKELEKQKFYVDNIDTFNDEIIEEQNINQCLTQNKIREMKTVKNSTGSVFNLSSIDNLTLDQLKELKMNIEREEKLGFVEPVKQKEKTIGTMK